MKRILLTTTAIVTLLFLIDAVSADNTNQFKPMRVFSKANSISISSPNMKTQWVLRGHRQTIAIPFGRPVIHSNGTSNTLLISPFANSIDVNWPSNSNWIQIYPIGDVAMTAPQPSPSIKTPRYAGVPDKVWTMPIFTPGPSRIRNQPLPQPFKGFAQPYRPFPQPIHPVPKFLGINPVVANSYVIDINTGRGLKRLFPGQHMRL